MSKDSEVVPGDIEFILASSLEYDQGNFKDAKKFYEKSILKGHKLAQFNLALWYLEGNRPGTKKDLFKARELFQASADQGVGMSMYNLGTLYENGEGGVKKNDVVAFKLYRRAVDEGKEWPKDGKQRVYLKLSDMYAKGRGTMRDLQEAARWMEKANKERALPTELMRMIDMLRQLDPGKRQTESDENWRRMNKYIDDLPEEEKPTTFKQWADVTKKFGYVPSNPIIKNQKGKFKKCNFAEYLELSGGSFKTLETFEMQSAPVPPPVCAFCKVEEEPGKRLKNCVRCREKYCSKECQRMDWKNHKKICDLIFAQIGP